jgi:adenine phosphoribosyltransferase
MLACINLVEHLQATIAGCAFVVELGFLEGRQRLANYDVFSLVNYADES